MVAGEGVAWWLGLDVGRNILIGDYLIGLTESADVNLTQAAMHLAEAVRIEAAHDMNTLRNMRAAAARGRRFGPWSEDYDNQAVILAGHEAGFFRAVGSVLDNLAGIVVGTVGIPTDIVRASWTRVAAGASPRTRTKKQSNDWAALPPEHQEHIAAFAGELADRSAAGRPDWIQWALDVRNMLVHRASRLAVQVQDAQSSTGFAHPRPKHPAQTHAESLARMSSLADHLVGRDTETIFDSVFTDLTNLGTFVASACVEHWDARRQNERLHHQPRSQWPRLRQGDERRYTPPGPQVHFRGVNGLVLNPATADRFRNAHLGDGDRKLWRSWLDADEGGDQ